MSINKIDAHSKADCTNLISNHCYTDLSSYTFDVQTIFQISDCTLSSSLIADLLEWLLQHLGNVCSFIPKYSVGESLCSLPIYSYNLSERNVFEIGYMSSNTVNSNNPCLYLNISSAYISNHCRDFCAKQSLIVCPSIPNNSHIDQTLVTRTVFSGSTYSYTDNLCKSIPNYSDSKSECLNFVCKSKWWSMKTNQL